MNEEKRMLENQIWITRISRTRAEKRLLDKEAFIQGINIYYSIVSIICSFISFSYDDKKMGLFTIIITIGLLVSILYLNGQRYGDSAKDYRHNYTALQQLEMELHNESCDVVDIRKRYCSLLDTTSNHIEFDYWCALASAPIEYQESKNWNKKRILWWHRRVYRWIIKGFVIIVPAVVLMLCEVYA